LVCQSIPLENRYNEIMVDNGYLLLEGGAEFGGQMAEPDLWAIELAGGFDAPISILPTAAAPDHNDQRAGQNGLRWFNQLGARQVAVLPLVDRVSADSPEIVQALRCSRLIYLLGGFPGHLYQSLAGSQSWQAMLSAYRTGAVIAGSSAGAMALCQHFYDPNAGKVMAGLNLLPGACVLPHHNTFGKRWAEKLVVLLPQDILIGIDEQTGLIHDGKDGLWKVYGKGGVTLYHQGAQRFIQPGAAFSVNDG